MVVDLGRSRNEGFGSQSTFSYAFTRILPSSITHRRLGEVTRGDHSDSVASVSNLCLGVAHVILTVSLSHGAEPLILSHWPTHARD